MKHDRQTILIVDDCPEDRETYRRYLLGDSRYTYTILEEEYGEDALALCLRVKPDVILLDFQLPDIDGIEFLKELKTQIGRNNLPVVMLTGQGNEAIAVAAMKNGASDYLVKGSMTPESLQIAIHNIVERDRLKKQLEQSEEKFRTSVENMLDCFGIYTSIRDRSGRIVDFLIEYVNAAACTSDCTTQEEQIGKHLLELQPSHWKTGLFDECCSVVETGKPLMKESLIYSDVCGNQQLIAAFDIRVTKLRDGFVAAWHDVTQKKQAEEQLRQSQHLIQRIADTIPDVLYIYDLNEQQNVYLNRQIAEVLGYTPIAIQKMGVALFQKLMHPDDLARIPAHFKRFERLENGEVIEIEYRMQHVNGKWRWFRSRDTVFARNPDGSPCQIVGSAQDITDRKFIEEEREQLLAREQLARAAAEAADRAKDEFLAMVSHELRNPLTSILGYTQLLQTRMLDEDTTDHAFETIESNVKLQAQLIDDLLDISRITSGKLHLNIDLLDLVFVIKTTIDTVRLTAEAKAIQISIETPFGASQHPKAAYIMGDANRLRQIVLNLLCNAIKFTPQGGRIQVQLELVDRYFQVVVSDTGQGISAEFLPYVFDRFRQAKSKDKHGGLGLGLAIVRHLVELHGGSVDVFSEGEGKGATFTVKLPIAPDADN